MELLSASPRSVLPGVVVRVVGHAELPVTAGVHLLPVQAALAEQVPADHAHGRRLQPDPARAPPVRKGKVADGLGRLHPGRVLTTMTPNGRKLRGRPELQLLTFAGHLGDEQHPAGASSRMVPTAGSAVSSATSSVQSAPGSIR